MRRVVLFVCAILSMFLISTNASAVTPGTVTATVDWVSADGNKAVIKLACVSDEGDGSVPATQIKPTIAGVPFEYWLKGYMLWELWVVDGSTAPDAADIAITDEQSRTLFNEANVIPTSGNNEGTIDKPKIVMSKMTMTVSNQATVDATYTVYIHLIK